MPDDPRILADKPVDDVPDPHTVRRLQYQGYVEKVRDTGRDREVRTIDYTAARAVYAGVTRAIERLGLEDQITATTRKNKDDTASVFIEHGANTPTTPTTTSPTE